MFSVLIKTQVHHGFGRAFLFLILRLLVSFKGMLLFIGGGALSFSCMCHPLMWPV